MSQEKTKFIVLDKISDGWTQKRLGEIATIESGYGFPLKYQGKSHGDIPFFKVIDISNTVLKGHIYLRESENYISYDECKKLKAKPFKKGTIVFAKIGAAINLNRRAILAQDSLVDNNVAGVFTTFNNLYLYYFLLTVKFGEYSGITAVPSLKKSDIENHIILFPPLNEQQKIASILSNVDELIQKTDQIIEQTQRLKKGLMQRLLTKGIEHSKFKRIKFNSIDLDIPENWEYMKMKILSLLSEDGILTGPFGSMLHSYDYVKEGTPLILIKNIRNGKIDDKDIPRITQKDVERLARYKVKKGDIVFSRVGRVGSAALIEETHNGWLISGLTLRIRFDNPEVNSQFVNYFIQLDIFQKVLKAGIFRSSRDVINTTILENSPVLLPPIEEQNKIVSRIFNIDNIIEKNEKILLHLQNLKKGLMQQLLTGKIRVKV